MTTATITKDDIRTFFQTAYANELVSRLAGYAAEDDLDAVIDDTDCIDGSLLNSVDQDADSATRQHYAWVDSELFAQAMEGPDCYEGIDYEAIIQSAKAKVAA